MTLFHPLLPISTFFFFNDTATTEIYTLSLHDALPICADGAPFLHIPARPEPRAARPSSRGPVRQEGRPRDRKSTRLNSSHGYISYAVFCLKKKNKSTAFLLSVRHGFRADPLPRNRAPQ